MTTHTWSLLSFDTRTAHNVHSAVDPLAAPVDVVCVNEVVFKVVADDGAGHTGTFQDRIILGDPVSVETAITALSPSNDILAAAKYAIGVGGISRWQLLADAALAQSE